MYFSNDWTPEDSDCHKEIVKIIKCKVSGNRYEISDECKHILTDVTDDVGNIRILYDNIQQKKLINNFSIMEILQGISLDQTSFFISVIEILKLDDENINCAIINMNETVFHKVIDEMNYISTSTHINQFARALLPHLYREKRWDIVPKIHTLILRFVKSSIDNIIYFDSKLPITILIREFSRYYVYDESAIIIFEFLSELLKDKFYHVGRKRVEISNYVKTFYSIKCQEDDTFEVMGLILTNDMKPKCEEIKNKVLALLSQYDMVFLSLQDRTETLVEAMIKKKEEEKTNI